MCFRALDLSLHAGRVVASLPAGTKSEAARLTRAEPIQNEGLRGRRPRTPLSMGRSTGSNPSQRKEKSEGLGCLESLSNQGAHLSSLSPAPSSAKAHARGGVESASRGDGGDDSRVRGRFRPESHLRISSGAAISVDCPRSRPLCGGCRSPCDACACCVVKMRVRPDLRLLGC